MATNRITDNLFGTMINPAQATQQYMSGMMVNPQQMAALDINRQIAAMGSNAGAMIGTGLGRLFGGRSPEEAQQEQMQGMLGGVDMADPDSLMELAQRLQSVNPAAAQELAQRAMTMRKTLMETQAKEAEMMGAQQGYQMRYEGLKSRYPEMAEEEARALAQDPAAFREIMKTPKVDTQVVETANGQILINKQTGQPIANLGPAPDRRNMTSVSVDARAATGVAKLVNDFESGVKTNREALDNARTAQNLINESIGSNNSQAWEQARTLVAKATGKGRLSNEDIRRTGVDPRLVQGVADWLNKKTVGVPNEDIQRQLFVVAKALERDAAQGINRVAERMRAVGAAENLDPTKLDVYFPGVEGTGAPQGTVNWSDLK